MCNLYNITTSQEAVRQWTRSLRDILGNLEPSIDIYPNLPGPVVRNALDGEREVANLLWGMPTPAERVKGKAELHSEAVKLIARYESPLETVKALMAYNCELETQILALAHRHPELVAISFDPTPPVLG